MRPASYGGFADAREHVPASFARLRFPATQINKELARQGYFWQGESFDHLVRSEEQYAHLLDYIKANPRKARLSPGEYAYYRKE
jgi:putative transposase